MLAILTVAVAGAALLWPARSGSAHQGGYLEFTGPDSGYLQVPDSPILNPSGAITVEAWVYLYSYTGWGQDPHYTDCPMLVGKNWSDSYAMALGCGGDVMETFVNGISYFEDTAAIPLGTWTHLAMTYGRRHPPQLPERRPRSRSSTTRKARSVTPPIPCASATTPSGTAPRTAASTTSASGTWPAPSNRSLTA